MLLRFLLKDVPEQALKVRKRFQEAKNKKLEIVVPQIVIFEVVFALKSYYHFKKDKVIEGLKTVVATPYLSIEDEEIFTEALKAYKKETIALVDAFLIAKAKNDGTELFTFDKKLINLLKSI